MRKGVFLALAVFLCVLGWGPVQSHACCVDRDKDGYGVQFLWECPHPEPDCDDTNPAVNPGATEVCNGIDDNCDGVVDDVDADGDGFVAYACGGADCDDANPAVNPEAAEVCNGTDDDCNGQIDDINADQDGVLVRACGGDDCDDANPAVHPGAFESCSLQGTCEDGLDNDCNGLADSQDPACMSWCMPGPSSTVEAQGTAESGHWMSFVLLLVPFGVVGVLLRRRSK